jgi:hypoxanthine-DNA glycosylase
MDTQTAAKACLPPVVTSNTSLLILGSLPGDVSLAAERYYAHPQNQFWQLLGSAIGESLADLDYVDRLTRLQSRGVGLWDTVASAVRPGSLDGSMRAVAANPLLTLIADLPLLRAVAFNGGTASRIGRRVLGETGLTLIDLPSSSPAYTRPFDEKAQAWASLAPFAERRQ